MALDASGYFVWNPEKNAPAYRHPNLKQAVMEADRLAQMNPGQQFIVLHALGAASRETPVLFKWADGCRHHLDDDGMPF